MEDDLIIYFDRLQNGHHEQFTGEHSSSFLEVNEPELVFAPTLTITYTAYLANHELLLHLSVSTTAWIPCSICNEQVAVPLSLGPTYTTIPLSSFSGATLDLREEIREFILLQTPRFAECQNGCCPQRKVLNKYFAKDDQSDPSLYHPFSDL